MISYSPLWETMKKRDISTYTGDLEKVDIITDQNTQSSRGSEIREERIKVPDYAHLIPKEIAGFTTNTVYNNENTPIWL